MKLDTLIDKYTELPLAIRSELNRRSSPMTTYLYELIASNGFVRALEIGTFKGRNSLFMAAALQETHGTLTTVNINSKELQQAQDLLEGTFEIDNVNFIESDSLSYLKGLKHSFFDIVFIDGNHSYNYSKKEFDLVRPLLMNSSIVILDDAGYIHPDSKGDGGVPRTVKEIGAIPIQIKDKLIAVKATGGVTYQPSKKAHLELL